jgi:hypothetical protein
LCQCIGSDDYKTAAETYTCNYVKNIQYAEFGRLKQISLSHAAGGNLF